MVSSTASGIDSYLNPFISLQITLVINFSTISSGDVSALLLVDFPKEVSVLCNLYKYLLIYLKKLDQFNYAEKD